MSFTREEHLYMAKVCEQSDRFQDMLDHMKAVCEKDDDLSTEERNLLSVAYKNVVGNGRTAWRILSSLEGKEENKKAPYVDLLKKYKTKIEAELNQLCLEIISLLDKKLIKEGQAAEANIFYLKMKGDYYRYMSEYLTDDKHLDVGKKAHSAYEKALEKATLDLKTTHPIRLGLALNYSVFYYEVLNDPSKACQLAKQAFDDAIADIEQIEEEQYKDATTIMQLIRDNLTLWTTELEEREDN